MFDFLVCITLCPNLDEEERAGCFAFLSLIVFRMLVTANVLWVFLRVLWHALQCVIVVFPDYTQFS